MYIKTTRNWVCPCPNKILLMKTGGWSIGHRLLTSILKDIESGYRILGSRLFFLYKLKELLKRLLVPLLLPWSPESNQILFPCRWLTSASVTDLRVLFSFNGFPHGCNCHLAPPNCLSKAQLLIKQRCLLDVCRDQWLRRHASKAGGVEVLISGWGLVSGVATKPKQSENKQTKPRSLWEDLSNVSERRKFGRDIYRICFGGVEGQGSCDLGI